MNTHYTYFLILAVSLAGPLALSFDKKVAFYKKWKYLFPAMLLPALLYILWDNFFTSKGVWGFNETYISGNLIYNLPIEEVLFFFIVPYCCVFIYECIRCYFPHLKGNNKAKKILGIFGMMFLLIGVIFYDRYYTSWTFVFCSVFIALLFAFPKFFKDFDAGIFLVAYAIILVPFLLVNGFLTAIPVVVYNDAENLGIRIYTIPIEDAVYGMLLVMMIVAGYERLRNKEAIGNAV